MSVNTSEEYLDELLQAIEPIIHTEEPMETPEEVVEMAELPMETAEVAEDMTELPMETAEVAEDMTESRAEIAEEPVEMTETPVDTTEESVSVNDLLESIVADESEEAEEALMSEEDIDAMLNAAMNSTTSANDNEPDRDFSEHDEDVKELLKQFTEDEDLTDINDILERHDNNEAVDDSLLRTPDVEVFKVEEEEIREENEEKEPKGLFGFFKKRKNKKHAKYALQETSESQKTESEETEDTLLVDDTPKANVEVEIGAHEWGEVDAKENTVAVEAMEELDADVLIGDSDTSDIELLLSGGALFENKQSYNEELQGIEEKKEVLPENTKKKGKKVSLFSRIFNMLTEEEEEPAKTGIPEADVTGITDENIAILDELSKEDKKKAKLEKKEKKKKEKEAKKKRKDLPEGEEEDEGDGKKEKKTKKAKVKKEKPRKVVELDAKPEKKLSRKKVSVVFLFCFSILAMILILQNVFLNFSNMKEARWAFDNADYETCYVNLYGKDLSEEDQEIFDKSYVILTVQRKLDSYENFVQLGMDLEALDALFEGVRVYRDMEERANELGILDRISGIHETIYAHFSDYGLTSDDVEEILGYESKVTYTKRLNSIVNGTPFEETVSDTDTEEESPADAKKVVEEENAGNKELNPEELEDVLEQEEDFLGDL